MGKRKKRILKKLFQQLVLTPIKPTGKPGKIIGKRRWQMGVNRKDRRHDGRVEGKYVNPKMKYKEAHTQAIEPTEFWNDWIEYRDGRRAPQDDDPECIKHEQAIRHAQKNGRSSIVLQ